MFLFAEKSHDEAEAVWFLEVKPEPLLCLRVSWRWGFCKMSKRGEHRDNGTRVEQVPFFFFHLTAVVCARACLTLLLAPLPPPPAAAPSGEQGPRNATLSFPRESRGSELCGRKSLLLLFEKTTCI